MNTLIGLVILVLDIWAIVDVAGSRRQPLQKLLKGVSVVTRPRLSHLAYAGSKKLTRLPRRTAIVAFPVYTFAVLAGAMWAEAAWGRYWGWDPKETTAFITWKMLKAFDARGLTLGTGMELVMPSPKANIKAGKKRSQATSNWYLEAKRKAAGTMMPAKVVGTPRKLRSSGLWSATLKRARRTAAINA